MAKKANRFKKMILLAGDLVIIVASINLSMFIRFHFFTNIFTHYTVATIFTVVTYVTCFYIFDMYNLKMRFRGTYFLSRFLVSVLIAAVVTTVFFYAFPSWRMGRGLSLLNMLFISVFAYYWRAVFQKRVAASWKPRRMAVVGAGRAGQDIIRMMDENKDFVVVGFFDDSPDKTGLVIGRHRVAGGSSLLREMADRGEIDAVLVAITHEKHPDLLRVLLDVKVKGVDIYDVPTFYEQLKGALPVEHMRDGWIVYASFYGMRNSMYAVHVKRLIDLVVSFFGMIILSPVLLVTAIMTKVDSNGPIFFFQKRVGLSGRVFEILKFRSMKDKAETSGAVWASEKDPRVTRVGRIIRKTRIDELPQLWNVFTGEMSFIGPRPERPEFVLELNKDIPFYTLRHAVKPGITGWGQVSYRYGASKEDAIKKLQYDLFYLKNLSFLLDLQILLKTIRVILFLEGGR